MQYAALFIDVFEWFPETKYTVNSFAGQCRRSSVQFTYLLGILVASVFKRICQLHDAPTTMWGSGWNFLLIVFPFPF